MSRFWPVRSTRVLVVALLVAGCGGHATADDQAFHQAWSEGRANAEVVFDGTLVQDPVQVGTHEHLVVRTPTGETVEVDHNTDLAPSVPAHTRDKVVIQGVLYDDSGREGVHCTHAATSTGCPYGGWIELQGQYYE